MNKQSQASTSVASTSGPTSQPKPASPKVSTSQNTPKPASPKVSTSHNKPKPASPKSPWKVSQKAMEEIKRSENKYDVLE